MLKKIYTTPRLTLQASTPQLAKRVLAFYRRNEAFLQATEPLRAPSFYTYGYHRRALARERRAARNLSALRLWILPRGNEASGKIMGVLGFSCIMYEPFCSALVYYKLDEEQTGQGYVHEAMQTLLEIAFRELRLHRLEANIMPRNERSLNVVRRLGFQEEGLAKKYLKINGVWEDHIHMVLLNEQVE